MIVLAYNIMHLQNLCGHSRQDDIMEDYCDGSQFKQHPLFPNELHLLQVMLYFDEVEVCNPLGSSAKIHKLGVFRSVYVHVPV